MWLDANKPKAASRIFHMAEDALIQSKQYRLCGKYIDPDLNLNRIVCFIVWTRGSPRTRSSETSFGTTPKKRFRTAWQPWLLSWSSMTAKPNCA